ncbi:MAG: hypothetical protein ABL921_00260 [Pirellula sp.]
MARCDQGYLCRVCGDEVEHITDSELYLRFVIGEVDPEMLHLLKECHLRCSPAFSQFIADDRFGTPVIAEGPFGLLELDKDFVETRSALIAKGYDRLWAIRTERKNPLTVPEYPLPEVRLRWK